MKHIKEALQKFSSSIYNFKRHAMYRVDNKFYSWVEVLNLIRADRNIYVELMDTIVVDPETKDRFYMTKEEAHNIKEIFEEFIVVNLV